MSQLTDIATVRQYLKVDGSAHDDLLERLIDACSAEIEAWCGQPILAETDNVMHRFAGSNTALEQLPYFPIVEVGALTYVTSIGGEAVALETDTYSVTRGRLVGSSAFWGAYEYELALTVGYAAESIPADVVQVCVEMVAVRAKESFVSIGEGRIGKKSIGVSVAGTSTSTLFERPDWQARLAPYRVVTI